ncbi:MAG: peptide-methionine (S)-S-oxide reductase MsrA [Alloprevotella sp.]|nr:peptide-methionine (S)-S-oxide reductase MsrA [Alloprevotella sp.]
MKTAEIYFAGGCFWGTEHFFKQVRGVVDTQVGYANGHADAAPTYEEVCTDRTGFAETVRVRYDADVASLEFLVRMYFHAIDPTSLNRQGHDVGTQYRTGVFYTDAGQLPVLEAVFNEVRGRVGEAFAVELLPLRNFYAAEDYHQDYLDKNPAGYCHLPLELFRWAKAQEP